MLSLPFQITLDSSCVGFSHTSPCESSYTLWSSPLILSKVLKPPRVSSVRRVHGWEVPDSISIPSPGRFGRATPAKQRGSYSACAIPLGSVSTIFLFSIKKARFQVGELPKTLSACRSGGCQFSPCEGLTSCRWWMETRWILERPKSAPLLLNVHPVIHSTLCLLAQLHAEGRGFLTVLACTYSAIDSALSFRVCNMTETFNLSLLDSNWMSFHQIIWLEQTYYVS